MNEVYPNKYSNWYKMNTSSFFNDYENFEFISPVNPWNVQQQYKADFNKLRSIDVTLMPGQIVHIPAYWWYSIKFVKSNTTICVFKYKTYMSTLSISNHLFMRILQRQNTKRVIAKRVVVKDNKNDGIVSDANKVNTIDNIDNVDNVHDNKSNKVADIIQDSMATSTILKNNVGSEIVETVEVKVS
jgi:hypothetical protein